MEVVVTHERPVPPELSNLFAAVGWGEQAHDALGRSIRAYTTTLCARVDGRLVGYASVFSDGHLTTMFGEFVVHPEFQRSGIGREMMRLVEETFPAAPIYVKALGEADAFYRAIGFRESRVPTTCLFKRPEAESRHPGFTGE